jgi:hypothetical protein
MTTWLRFPRRLYQQIEADLCRPHAYAHERVGFVFARTGTLLQKKGAVLAVDYLPIPDEMYVRSEDRAVGAAITADAIRLAMQRVYTDKLNAYHIHWHTHRGMPRFSTMDRQDLPPIVEAFGHAHPSGIHGALLLSNNTICGVSWLPDNPFPLPIERIVIVGFPTIIVEGDTHVW